MIDLLLTLAFILGSNFTSPATDITTSQENVKVTEMLKKGITHQKDDDLILWYAQQFLGTPYVRHTLEGSSKEKLVINLDQLDCTTFVETVVALTKTTQNGKTDYPSYCHWLTRLRYNGGKIIDYSSRNHYFSQWIESNSKQGIVEEICDESPSSLWCEQKSLTLSFMSQHPDLYPALKENPETQKKIYDAEQLFHGKTTPYIPKRLLNVSRQRLSIIHDGDIIVLVARKDGLDTTHMGFAVWEKDGQLHLLHASSLYKRVILDKTPLYQYMKKQPGQIGIRVVRVKSLNLGVKN